MALLWYSDDDEPEAWLSVMRRHVPDLEMRVFPEVAEKADIDMALVWLPPPGLLASLPNLKVVFSLAAGVDAMLKDATLPDVPLCRMVDPTLTRGMSEFVLFNVLKYHRLMHVYAAQQRRAEWRLYLPQPPESRTVGIMGLGELGRDAARVLVGHGFKVRGWSRREREIEGVECFAGVERREAFLGGLDMLVCLLPLTDETEGMLDARLLAALPRGAFLIHVGRGRQLVADDLLAALQRGHLGGASLDVVPEEPLPAGSPLWRHPLIDLTPHTASYTHPESGALNVAMNIQRYRRGEPLVGVVDRARGY